MGQRGVLTMTACAIALSCSSKHYVQRGADLYSAGRYVEADEVLDRSEPRVARAPIEERAEYATYRGATFLALGDLPHAQQWLRMASEIEHARPGTLSRDERALLEGAWRAVASRTPTAPLNTAVASSSQVPPPHVDPALPNAAVQERSLLPQ